MQSATPDRSRKASDPALTPTNGRISKTRTPSKASFRVSQSEVSQNEPTKTNDRLQGLEIILKRYGGDAPSRPLTSSKSTPLPTSQRLRLTASARRPIEEDNPFNPARVSRGGVPGSNHATRDDDRRRPSNPIQRTHTMVNEGSVERYGATVERRSMHVR